MSVQTTSNSTVSQFGLHRTIDSRTERFLKLSKRRQIRQGCACAAVTAAITVTVVIVILLIYEYAIVVESNLVQIGGPYRRSNDSIHINDTPVADRLDRTYLGFDQDYFEQMPLLVNAMQENNYNDPLVESAVPSSKRGRYLTPQNYTTQPTVVDYRASRKTSPRPFIFEYRSPTPSPFHKNFNSRSWIESYRNAQRLKNLEQVIKYLEKTINAKFGDIYTLPSSNHIAFSGVLQPASTEVKSPLDTLPQASYKVQSFKKANHQADPYFNFKPDSPGDVNLLADGHYKFSLVPNPSFISKHATRIPLFRPISRCVGNQCSSQSSEKKYLYNSRENSGELNSAETVYYDRPKSLNVMLNLLPLASTQNPYYTKDVSDSVYFTTSRPLFQLRRKSVGSSNRRRVYVRRIKRPRLLSETTTEKSILSESASSENGYSSNEVAKVLLHLDVFPKIEESTTTTTTTTTTTESPTTSTQITFTPSHEIVYPPYVPTCPPLCAVEDYHIGSSGVVPIELRTYPTTQVMPLPPATTVIPFFNNVASSEQSHIWTTAPTEILRFSQEDARIPEEYKHYRTEDTHVDLQTEANRRNSGSFESDETKNTSQELNERENDDVRVEDKKDESNDFEELEDERRKMLIVKLRNYLESSTEPTSTEKSTVENQGEETLREKNVTEKDDNKNESPTDSITETTTTPTYVPQINGHYRNVNQNSKQVNEWFEGPKVDRKDKLEVLPINGLKRTTPKYVEIHRNAHSITDRNEE